MAAGNHDSTVEASGAELPPPGESEPELPPTGDNGASPADPTRLGKTLLRKLLRFGLFLRDVGLDANPGKMIELVRSLASVDFSNRTDFYMVTRCTLLSRHEDAERFKEAFDLFWNMQRRGEGRGVSFPNTDLHSLPPSDYLPEQPDLPEVEAPLGDQDSREQKEEDFTPTGQSENADESEGEAVPEYVLSYSASELLQSKNFEFFTLEEIQQSKTLMERMNWKLGRRPSRRRIRAQKGKFIDLRQMVRESLRHGGEFIELSWRKTKLKPRPIVLICDISGSMDRYSRLLLQFVHTLARNRGSVESFVFATRLTRITHELRSRDIDTAVQQVAESVQDWSGGTRIGESLKTFNFKWSRRVLGRGAIVLLISDGWDRGESSLLSEEIGRLHRSCYRLIWLNPLLGSPGYEPLTVGIQAALPHLDKFLPVHNLASLEELGKVLQDLDVER